MNNILITGATGKLGSQVVDELIRRRGAENVSILVRNLAKAAPFTSRGVKAIEGDYNDYSSLERAFEGVDRLYFISGSDVVNRGRQHENVVKAAQQARVNHIIYTSFQRVSDEALSPIAQVASGHLIAEKLIRESGLTYTIMKHALYAEVLPLFMTREVLNAGMIYLPAGAGKASFTSRADMALAGVEVLMGEGHENRSYEISADQSYSFYDIAEMLTELSGKEIKYNSPTVDTFTTALLHAGMPQDQIHAMTSFCTAISRGAFDYPDTTLERLIGRKPQSLKEFLREKYRVEEAVESRD